MTVKGKKHAKEKGGAKNMVSVPDDGAARAPGRAAARPSRLARIARAFAFAAAPFLFMPLAAALLLTLYRAEREIGAGAEMVMSPPSLMFAAGMLLATLLCVAFRNSVRPYLRAHEFTHALFGWICFAKVSDLVIARFGGKVRISKSNIMILLSPYFVPFYAFLLVMVYAPVSLFIPMSGTVIGRAYVFFIGLAWGHHFWWTFAALWQLQPDLRDYGCFFSVTLILFANLLALCLLFGIYSPITWSGLLAHAGNETAAVFAWLYDFATYLAGFLR